MRCVDRADSGEPPRPARTRPGPRRTMRCRGRTRAVGCGQDGAPSLRGRRGAWIHGGESAGREFESAVPFAGLHELLRPLLPHAAELAESQAESLRAALALAHRADLSRSSPPTWPCWDSSRLRLNEPRCCAWSMTLTGSTTT